MDRGMVLGTREAAGLASAVSGGVALLADRNIDRVKPEAVHGLQYQMKKILSGLQWLKACV